jgi:NAD(P)-dependent dehydrogenase (short-subunit alcohol dehydrogenase family)
VANEQPNYRALFDLSDQVAFVTGASGILGSTYANALAEYGANVVLVDLNGESLERQAQDLRGAYGRPVMTLALDVSRADAVANAVALVEDSFGPISILLNNAASKGSDLSAFFAPTEAYSIETWREIMSVNVDGVFLVAREIGTRMAKRGSGSIVNIASIYGVVGPDQRIYEGSRYMDMAINTPAVYAASKAGVVGLTRYLATLWGDRGVRVNTLTPGGVESGQNDIFRDRYAARTPLGRMARRDEMVGAVLYLASPASSYVTGHNLVVDGGWSVW